MSIKHFCHWYLVNFIIIGICIDQYRCAIGMFNRASHSFVSQQILRVGNLIYLCMNIAYIMTIIFLIQMLAMDIETNPGPNNRHETDNNMYRDLNICHLNIQSMKRNEEKLKHIELQLGGSFDVITVSETWLSNDDLDSNYSLNRYHSIYRRDRGIGRGGGVAAWNRHPCGKGYKTVSTGCFCYQERLRTSQ